MARISYPSPLRKGDRLAITAPSSGVEDHLHPLLAKSKVNVERLGFVIVEGNTIWTNDKCVSSSLEMRVRELESYLLDDTIQAIIPPWGGEFLMEILPLLNWDLLKQQSPKWILGYSDISTFTFAYTLLTGHASAHGPNYIDLGAELIDDTTAGWRDVLSMDISGKVKQTSSKLYRSSWEVAIPDRLTKWASLDSSDSDVRFSGRLIGGCLDTLSILLGTAYAPLERFSNEYCKEEGLLWYLESCEMNAADIYRHLWQMRQCGWFNHTNGILIGRATGYSSRKNFELIDALQNVFGPLGIPVIYDADIGHTSPQITLVNGAVAEVFYSKGQGEITITFA